MRVNDLKSLMAFISVVEQGSFTKASEKLHLTRSAVSKMISKLEVQLGVVLFNRDTRHLALTEEGSIFYEHSQRAVQELLIAETLFESNNQNIQGMIRISMPVLFGQKFIVPILRDLADEHQNLNMVLSFNDRYIDLIEDNYDL
ncbi:LysR family transcriptional regulator, partial [Acinetobacter sp. YH16032]